MPITGEEAYPAPPRTPRTRERYPGQLRSYLQGGGVQDQENRGPRSIKDSLNITFSVHAQKPSILLQNHPSFSETIHPTPEPFILLRTCFY